MSSILLTKVNSYQIVRSQCLFFEVPGTSLLMYRDSQVSISCPVEVVP